MQREKKILSDCSTEFKETVWDWKAGGHKSSSVGLCHLQLPVLITYCDKLQSFERPDLLCFSCSRECAWHWVAELQSPSFSTMSRQVIVSASSSVSLVPILENVHEGGHPRSWNWKEDWAQHWPGVSLDELGHGRSCDRKQGCKGRAVMIPCQCCAWSHFQCCDPLWPTSLRMVRVKSLQACPDDQRSQLSVPCSSSCHRSLWFVLKVSTRVFQELVCVLSEYMGSCCLATTFKGGSSELSWFESHLRTHSCLQVYEWLTVKL